MITLNIKRVLSALVVLLLLVPTAQVYGVDAYLIRTYRIELAVESLDAALPRILTMPGVDLQSVLDIQAGSGRMERLINNHELDATLNILRGMGQVTGTSSNSRNEFAQLRGLQAEFTIRNIEYRNLTDLLHQAATLSDFRIIEGRLVNIISEIESLRGRINYLNSEVGTTRLHITLATIPPVPEYEPEPEPESTPEPESEPEGGGAFYRISTAFARSADATLSIAQGILIFLAHISLPLAAVLIVGFCAWRVARKIKPKTKTEGDGNEKK